MGARPKTAVGALLGNSSAVAPAVVGQLADLGIAVDRHAEIPIGVQLAWALRTRIRDGSLRPGQRLPGLREMAHTAGVNVNTVRSVYQRLEQDGLIDSQQGSGTFVTPTLQRTSAVASIVADAAREAHQTGVDPREVAAALYVSRGVGAHSRDDASERRRALREQIATLERTLVELEAKHPGVAPVATRTGARVGPALLDAAELEQVREGLVRRLTAVQVAIDALASDGCEGEPVPRAGDGSLRAAPAVKRPGRARATIRPASEGA